MNNIFEFVDVIYYINSSTRPERQKSLEIELAKISVDIKDTRVIRVEAVYPKDHEVPKEVHGVKFDGNKGQWGCIQSHMKIWEDIRGKSSGNVLILEDDVEFDKNFYGHFSRIQQELSNSKFELFWLRNFTDSSIERARLVEKHASGLARRDGTPFETHAYIVNCDTINMYNHFNCRLGEIVKQRHKAFEFAIDNLLMFCVQFKKIYTVTGFELATQKRNEFPTDIK